ncbi:MAG: helix-turn-helix domain-containing protein, partial [bacterium]
KGVFVLDTQAYRSEFVRDLRERMGCDQRTFAGIVGVTPAAVSRWENERAMPRNPRWEKLYDLKEELKATRNPERLVELLRVASSICPQEIPMELLVEGRLKTEIQSRLREMDLLPGDPRSELIS